VLALILLFNTDTELTTDTEDNDNNNIDISSASCGTSPVESHNNDSDVDHVVYNVDGKDTGDESDIPERPAESVEAELGEQTLSY